MALFYYLEPHVLLYRILCELLPNDNSLAAQVVEVHEEVPC